MISFDYNVTGGATTLTTPPAIVATLEAFSRESAVTMESDRPWRQYLENIKQPTGTYTAAHVARVRRLWETLRTRVGHRLPLPLTQPTNSGAIQLAWDAGQFYVEINVLPSGELEWFFRDRISNELDGTEDAGTPSVPPELLRRLAHVLPA